MVKNSSVYEMLPNEYNEKLAEALKKNPEFKMPEWAFYVKTGTCKSRPPEENDWWYNRAASILRQIYIKGIVGVARLRNKYGDRKNRGMKPETFALAGGKIIRVMLQQGEKAGFLEKVKEGKKFGRRLTRQGKEFLEAIK